MPTSFRSKKAQLKIVLAWNKTTPEFENYLVDAEQVRVPSESAQAYGRSGWGRSWEEDIDEDSDSELVDYSWVAASWNTADPAFEKYVSTAYSSNPSPHPWLPSYSYAKRKTAAGRAGWKITVDSSKEKKREEEEFIGGSSSEGETKSSTSDSDSECEVSSIFDSPLSSPIRPAFPSQASTNNTTINLKPVPVAVVSPPSTVTPISSLSTAQSPAVIPLPLPSNAISTTIKEEDAIVPTPAPARKLKSTFATAVIKSNMGSFSLPTLPTRPRKALAVLSSSSPLNKTDTVSPPSPFSSAGKWTSRRLNATATASVESAPAPIMRRTTPPKAFATSPRVVIEARITTFGTWASCDTAADDDDYFSVLPTWD